MRPASPWLRAAAVAWVVASAGCVMVIPAATAVLPPVIGMTAVPMPPSTAHATLAAGPVRGVEGHQGGWGVSLDTSSVGKLYVAHGKLELGRWGRDRLYGSTGAEVGVGMGGGGFGLGLLVGYGYGGFPQNGHQVPLAVMGFVRAGPVNLRLRGYVGWRFGVRHEYPAATDSFGPGWNTYGAELSTITGRGEGIGLALSLGIDRQDGIDAAWLKLGVGVGVSTR